MINFKLVYWKQILFLLIITPILTELLTNNIPANQFFRLKLFFLLATWVYGPVLLLRELAARWRLGFVGYVLLGIVYGIYNEGLLAKTIFQTHLPNPSFNNYGYALGISFSWATIIFIFHAFYAFIFPLLIVYYFFPSSAQKPWMDKRIWLFISAAIFIYTSWEFLKKMIPPVTALHFVFLITGMALLIWLSKRFQDKKMFTAKPKAAWLFCLYGFAFVIAIFTLSDMIVRSGVNIFVFISYLLAILFVTIILLRKQSIQTLLVFCLCAEIGFAGGAAFVAKITHSQNGVITGIFFICIFTIALIILLIRKQHTQNSYK